MKPKERNKRVDIVLKRDVQYLFKVFLFAKLRLTRPKKALSKSTIGNIVRRLVVI